LGFLVVGEKKRAAAAHSLGEGLKFQGQSDRFGDLGQEKRTRPA